MGWRCALKVPLALACACSLGGCIESGLSRCANGRVCGRGLTCDDATDSCVAGGDTPACGDRTVDSNESCDDGNWLSHDGCDSRCNMETPTWTMLDATTANRSDHAMAYDAYRGRVVMFGGVVSSSTVIADTREWDGTQWIQVASASAPSARSSPMMAYDPQRRSVLLFGGSTGSFMVAGDTLEWNGTAWTPLTSTTGNQPSARRDGAMALDRLSGRLVLFGGETVIATDYIPNRETWIWDRDGWTQATPTGPPGLFGHTMASLEQGPLLFGGTGYGMVYNDLWRWNATTWEQIPPAIPVRRASHAMASLLGNRALLFGGGFPTSTIVYDDTWVYDDGWTQLLGTHPSGRIGSAMAYDAVHRYVLLAGGYVSASGYQTDTWSFRYEAPGAVDETCNAGEDADGDTLEGCDDPDCWPYCTPECPPGAVCPAGAPSCGDGDCNTFLEVGRCPVDCP